MQNRDVTTAETGHPIRVTSCQIRTHNIKKSAIELAVWCINFRLQWQQPHLLSWLFNHFEQRGRGVDWSEMKGPPQIKSVPSGILIRGDSPWIKRGNFFSCRGGEWGVEVIASHIYFMGFFFNVGEGYWPYRSYYN